MDPKKSTPINRFIRREVLNSAIKDAEWRIGSYIVLEGHEKSDEYVQKQIGFIKTWAKELEELRVNDNSTS